MGEHRRFRVLLVPGNAFLAIRQPVRQGKVYRFVEVDLNTRQL